MSIPISVVIVNWSSWDILSRCLERLECQTFQNFNVLVIDNASDQPAPAGLLLKSSDEAMKIKAMLLPKNV